MGFWQRGHCDDRLGSGRAGSGRIRDGLQGILGSGRAEGRPVDGADSLAAGADVLDVRALVHAEGDEAEGPEEEEDDEAPDELRGAVASHYDHPRALVADGTPRTVMHVHLVNHRTLHLLGRRWRLSQA
jgi:hypothetical protein